MYELTCGQCLFKEGCARAIPCSNFTPTDEELAESELIEHGRQQYYEEWLQYLANED